MSIRSFPRKRNKDNRMNNKMLILKNNHKSRYVACSMTIWFSLSLVQAETMPRRPFIVNIPLYLERQFSQRKLLPYEHSKKSSAKFQGKNWVFTWHSIKSLRKSN